MEKIRVRFGIENTPVAQKQLSCNCSTWIFKWRIFCRLFACHGNDTSIHDEHRVFTIDSRSDPTNTIFSSNRIRSNKYTIWNFIPKNLFEQFRRVANFYFLVSAIIAMAIDSPVSPLTTFLPLLFVILVTAGKQGYEDFLRHRLDSKVNRTPVTVIRNKCVQVIDCEEIVVGDIVKVSRDEDVSCDIILLYSSELNGCCHVTTSNLDGETNLKALQVPRVTMDMSVEDICAMEALVTCQHPCPNLYEFQGKIDVRMRDDSCATGSLTIDNILLRGSRLKDTEFVIGASVYTGSDTKLSLNSKMTINKFSTIEKTINRYLIFLILVLLFEILFATTMKILYESNESWSSYLGEYTAIGFGKVINDMLSFTLLFNYIIPISLYVTVEIQKFLGSYFFRWDMDMYDERSDQPALANTSDLNEDLGQVEYLFTDKTGTLTENLMVFRRCSIDGRMYVEKDCDGKLYSLPVDGDEHEAIKVFDWPPEIWHFMIGITVCHTVHVAPPILMDDIVAKRTAFRQSFRRRSITRVNSSLLMDPNLPEYQATSADEKALVEASARCGVVLTRNDGDKIEVRVGNETLSFTKLDILEFTSERKRMSIIVKDTIGDIWLYCKGADSEMLSLIDEGKITETESHVVDLSKRGLRTLVIAYKKLTKPVYDDFKRRAEETRQIIGMSQKKYVEEVYYTIESGLTLLGATGIEDRLQEGVEETLESLRAAGIKVWIITGDKAETAENIAFSSGHFKSGTQVLRLMGQTTPQSCFVTLTSFERRLKLEPYKQYGLMIDGTSLTIVLKRYPELLRMVAMTCDGVVCCRMSPLQKSEIVQLIKNSRRHPLTAAIGDGGNDVSMIQEAHVGIGIMGREGRQATMSADFALSKFMYLKKALLVHGHWYYTRISILTQYFFYKNIVFITPQFFFGIHNGFSSKALYDSIYLMGFNIAFTSLPVLMFGLLAQDYPATKLLHYPQYYSLNKKNRLLSVHQRVIWVLIAIWQASMIYFCVYTYWYINPVNLWDSTDAGYDSYSTTIFHLVTIVTNLELLLRNGYWSYPFLLSIVGSEVIFFLVTLVYSSINIHYDGDMYWVFHQLICSPSFWLLTIVMVPACLLPDFAIVIYDSYRYLDLNYQQEREESLQVSRSEWSAPSTQVQKLRETREMRIATGYYRRLMVVVLLAALVYCVIQVLRSELSINDNDFSNSEKLMHISQLIKNSAKHKKLNNDDEVEECKLPDLDLNNPEILKFIHDVPPIKCSPEDWVIVDGSRLIIQHKAKNRYGQITCAFRDVLRVTDNTIKLSDAHESDDSYSLGQSDFVDVKCESQHGEQWHSVLAGVKDDPEIKKSMTWENVPESGLNLNVLMLGFDSLSRNTFIRKLPKTYRYLTRNLNAQVLQGYNIIGDGTPQALIPILTGKIELELPETRKRMGMQANYVDVYPMIWKKFKDSGYITGFMEDVPYIGTFTYRLKGFKEQPTDHYMRTYYLAAAPYFKNYKKFCMGSIPRHMVMMNYMKNIFDTYRDNPKFLFGFHGELSHDSYNDIGAADDDLNNWVKQLQDEGHLNNTLFIIMSDHGHRFAEIRDTLAGKQEERLPFFSFVFPPWFKQVHPKAYANFVYNTKRLSTPFDIHKTLESILKMDTPTQGDTSQRDISLFNEIPSYRTCADAYIEPHWCACLSWQDIPITNPIIIAAADSFIKFLNSYTQEHRNICQVLQLGEIIWSAKLIPTKDLLTFQKSGDLDGFMGDFSAKTELSHDTYQIKVKTQPGDGLFEASIEHDIEKNIFNTKISDVSRINKYGSQARCVENEFFHLRKYCYCKN